jgi:uncharacterized protein (TIGR00369 family)
MTHAPRSITVSWDDPMAAYAAGKGLSGLHYMQKLIAGEIAVPPIMRLIGYALLEVGEGRAVFGVMPAEQHYNPIGVVHGGIAMTLLDSAMGCAVHTLLPSGMGYTTLEAKTNLVRAITRETGALRATGKVIHQGRSTATAEARLEDATGRLYAHASATCILIGTAAADRATAG